jgi:UDP-glucose 4-epimerase
MVVILIVGGMGFIGMNTALRLCEVGEKIVIAQHSAHRIPDPLKDKVGSQVFTARMDVANAYEVFDVVRRHQVDSIINLMAPPARSVSTQADYQLYTAGLQNVLEAARVFGLRRVSLGSSVGVYNGLPTGPFREDVGLPVHSPTQVSAFKKGMEMHAHYYAGQAKLDVVALRIGSIYGPLYYSMHNPISRLCHAAVKNLEPDFRDRPDGKLFEDDQADWTYVKDVARGIPDAAHRRAALAPRVQHRLRSRELQQGRRGSPAEGRAGGEVRGAQAGPDPGDVARPGYRSLTDQDRRRLRAGAHARDGHRRLSRLAAQESSVVSSTRG